MPCVRLSISTVKIHPSYGQANQLDHDVCLLRLDRRISFPAHPGVRPVCLPSQAGSDYAELVAVVAGWGKTGGTAGISPHLQEARVLVWPQSACRQAFGGTVTSAMMCVSKQSSPIDSTCNGDSGGSVVYKSGGASSNFETIGVVSWGVEGCQANAPSVMARVTTVLSWIQDQISDSATCPRNFTPAGTSGPACLTAGGAVSGKPSCAAAALQLPL